MKRGIITNNGHGIHISDGEVWMTAWEIADLFYTTVGSINSRLKAILKANVLKKYDICQCIKLENRNSADDYSSILSNRHWTFCSIQEMVNKQSYS
mgnify:CR=1 FL=1